MPGLDRVLAARRPAGVLIGFRGIAAKDRNFVMQCIQFAMLLVGAPQNEALIAASLAADRSEAKSQGAASFDAVRETTVTRKRPFERREGSQRLA